MSEVSDAYAVGGDGDVRFAAGRLQAYSIIQVAVSNGSPAPYTIRPEDFTFLPEGGGEFRRRRRTRWWSCWGSRAGARMCSSWWPTMRRRCTECRTSAPPTATSSAASALMFGSSRFRAAGRGQRGGAGADQAPAGRNHGRRGVLPHRGQASGPGRIVVRTSTDTFEFKTEK